MDEGGKHEQTNQVRSTLAVSASDQMCFCRAWQVQLLRVSPELKEGETDVGYT